MRKIIHVDMDCFFAAIEERDHPELKGLPLAVAGEGKRSVLTTANYEARKYGCRSAMPLYRALEMCPELRVMPVRYEVYAGVSAGIRSIFGRFTDRIEPLSLDEAYLDVSHLQSQGAVIAREIRAQVLEEYQLTASAGISVNKMIAKIASDLNKPNGQFEVRQEEVADFIAKQPVGRLWGVGEKMRQVLAQLGVQTCADLQAWELDELIRRFGRWGAELWKLCRGQDDREVEVERVRKSLSCETTFENDISDLTELSRVMKELLVGLERDVNEGFADRKIRSLVLKAKFSDFQQTTVERSGRQVTGVIYEELLREAWKRGRSRAVRLLGVGVRFEDPQENVQMEFF